jgi:hypothetical protein
VPVPEHQFIRTWLNNDQTVICARGENKQTLPKYIPIENDDGTLFSCAGKLAGWHHGKKEIEFLKNLFKMHLANSNSPPNENGEGHSDPRHPCQLSSQ